MHQPTKNLAALSFAIGIVLLSGTSANATTLDPSPSPSASVAAAPSDSLTGYCNYNGAHPTLRYGSSGAAVSHAQCLLKYYNGYGYVAIDGIFGNETDTAVRDFQSRMGLTVDGIIGQATWYALHPH